MSHPAKRYAIGEVSAITGVPAYLLRQWEAKIPQLKPKRDRANRRFYTSEDIALVRRINYLLRHEQMTLPGIRLRLAQEILGEGRPRTRQELLDSLNSLEDELRALLALLADTN
jgi:DNA-binding transcriptional MerR regulator